MPRYILVPPHPFKGYGSALEDGDKVENDDEQSRDDYSTPDDLAYKSVGEYSQVEGQYRHFDCEYLGEV